VTSEQEIRVLFEGWALAIGARDLDAIVAHCERDLVWFDPLLQLQYRGLESYRRHWRASLSEAGRLAAGIVRLETAAGGDVAFSRALVRFERDGQATRALLHLTACLRRRRGRWLAVLEHFALPAEAAEERGLATDCRIGAA
jgi:ketosteroid isomerase-like protein